jgi:hypothetical protein
MNGVPRGSGSTGAGPSGEDLDAVLGRFQVWTQKYRAKPGAGSGEGREVSYEQALRASSYRRPTEFEPAPLREAAKERFPGADDEEASPLVAGPEPETAPNGAWAENSFAATATNLTPEDIRPSGRVSPELQTEPRAVHKPIVPIEASAGVQVARGQREATPQRIEPAAVAVPAAVLPVVPHRGKTRAAARNEPQPAFREVLKSTALATETSSRIGTERARSNALTLRVNDSEQARIVARAAEANLSVSAYLRQCALGVEELRGQVELALAALDERQSHYPPPGVSAIPGILGRFVMGILQSWRGDHAGPTTLSLK